MAGKKRSHFARAKGKLTIEKKDGFDSWPQE